MEMIEKEPYVLSVCKKEFESEEDFLQRFHSAVDVLIQSDYILTIKEEVDDCYVIKYAPIDEDWGCVYPRWISEEEYQQLFSNQYPEEG